MVFSMAFHNGKLSCLLTDFLHLLGDSTGKIQHVKREDNAVAHKLAREAVLQYTEL